MCLICLALCFSDLLIEILNLGHFLFLLFLHPGSFLLLLVDILLKVTDLVDFLHGHADGTAHILRLLPDLIDLRLALLERLLLLVVGGLEHVILGLVLLFECAVVVVTNDFVEERLELSLDLLKALVIYGIF